MADVATTPLRKDGKPRNGNSAKEAQARRLDFVRLYIANGRNGQQAAIDVGISNVGRGASHWATRTLRRPEVRALIDKELAKVSRITGLTLERTLLETARMAYSDPGDFYAPDGTMRPIADWSADMRAAVAQLETEDTRIETTTNGETTTTTGSRVKKLKFWPKPAAIDMAMRHLGAYERDNAQRSENLAIQVVLVGGPQK
jgi:phage terminase small subunit